ncbi:MAG: DUF5662 family protein [Lachnospiraceae bacterium]|nr:DUF5662 family protein [Lachnospiraceae bacterium]
MNKAWEHLKTITRHRHLVRKHCFAVGLYKQGICHDLSKYSPTEFLMGIKYYQGWRSPNVAEREEKGYSEAWLHHKGRNRHHFEYWLDFVGEGGASVDGTKPKARMVPTRMPVVYVVEMFMDRLAASKVYKGDEYTDASAWEYYNRGDITDFLHPRTRKILEGLLKMNAKRGEAYTFEFIRTKLLIKKKRCCCAKKAGCCCGEAKGCKAPGEERERVCCCHGKMKEAAAGEE